MRIITTDWETHKQAIQVIRELVFIKEQKVPEDLEWDSDDLSAKHFLVLNNNNQAIATGRLTSDGQIGRMAVFAKWRRQGIARKLLQHILMTAKVLKHSAVYLHAQLYTQDLYQGAGFQKEGESFLEAGIPHIKMSMGLNQTTGSIAPQESTVEFASEKENTKTENSSSSNTSQSYEPIVLAHINDFKDITIQLAETATRFIKILTPDLEPVLYDHTTFTEIISALCRTNKHTHVQILISGNPKEISSSHQVALLSQRLSSSITIRRVNPSQTQPTHAYMLTDTNGIMYRVKANEYRGFANLNNPAQVRIKSLDFERLWTHSSAITEFRRLGI